MSSIVFGVSWVGCGYFGVKFALGLIARFTLGLIAMKRARTEDIPAVMRALARWRR